MIASFVVLFALGLEPALAAGDQGHFTRSGLDPSAPPRTTVLDPAAPMGGQLHLLWSLDLPGVPPPTASRTETAAPATWGDRLYVAHAGYHGLIVLDRRDGDLLQLLPSRGPVRAGAVVGADGVFFADGAGYVWRYGHDGTLSWERYVDAPVLATVTRDKDVVYVANVEDQVYALDAGAGTLRWRHAHPLDAARRAPLTLYGAPPAVLFQKEILAGFSDGFLVALDAATGEPRWQAQVGEGAYPDLIAPVVPSAGGLLVGGYSEPLVSLDPGNLTQRWRLDVGSAAPMRVDGEIALHSGIDGKLRRLNTRTGELLWTWDSKTSGTLTTAVPTGIGLLVGGSESTLYVIDPESGAQKWHFYPDYLLSGITAAPAVSGEMAYAVSNAGTVYAFRARAPQRPEPDPPWAGPRDRLP